MDLAYPLEPAQELGGVGIDPDHFGDLVGDTDLDQLVELLIDTPLEEIDQPLPSDVRTAATAQLLNLSELIQSVLELLSDLGQALKFGRFGLELIRRNDGEFFFTQLLQGREIGIDDLMQG